MTQHSGNYLRYTFEQYLRLRYHQAQAVTPEQQLAVIRTLKAERQQLPAFIGRMLDVPPLPLPQTKNPQVQVRRGVDIELTKASIAAQWLVAMATALLVGVALMMAGAGLPAAAFVPALSVIPATITTALLLNAWNNVQDTRLIMTNFVLVSLMYQLSLLCTILVTVILWSVA